MTAEITSSADSRSWQLQSSLLDGILQRESAPSDLETAAADSPASQGQAGERLAAFLSQTSDARSLALWFGDQLPAIPDHLRSRVLEHVRNQPGNATLDSKQLINTPLFQRLELQLQLAQLPANSIDDLARRLSQAIARIDGMIGDQVNATIHHPRFQKLEASWRGLRYLTEQVEDPQRVRIRALNLTWKELTRDMERAIDFDQSLLFRKVYSDEFGMPGGEPFGLLIGDYEIRPTPDKDYPHHDIATLAGVSQVAAAAFAPFVSADHPSMFGLDDYAQLERSINLQSLFQQSAHTAWRNFRENYEDSRFIGLTMPRVLRRLPYEDLGPSDSEQRRIDGFRFEEQVSGPNRDRYLWGNAAYAFASVAIRAFENSGWFADIRGVERGVASGGLVTDLPTHSFHTDRAGVALKSSTGVVITDQLEKEIHDLGFLPLCTCKDTEYSAFYNSPSVQKPKRYDTPAATTNARMTSMLHYTLCVSRFAHYLKILARDKIGGSSNASDIERLLHDWVVDYVTDDADASPEIKSRRPLREARVRVQPVAGQPGHYDCVMHLLPHFELDDLTAAVTIRSQLQGIAS